jgi:hypothetical protein
MSSAEMHPETRPNAYRLAAFGGGRHEFAESESEVWDDNRAALREQAALAQSFLFDAGIFASVDEVAIMVNSIEMEYGLVESAVRYGYAMFNAASDHVQTSPIESDYNVHYTFLQHPEDNFRLEIMRMEEGVSPLHTSLADRAFRNDFNGPVVVHTSFKAQSLGDLGDVESLLEKSSEFEMAMSCRSTYGAFSYWTPTTYGTKTEGIQLYLKPRANLRDSSVPASAETAE